MALYIKEIWKWVSKAVFLIIEVKTFNEHSWIKFQFIYLQQA